MLRRLYLLVVLVLLLSTVSVSAGAPKRHKHHAKASKHGHLKRHAEEKKETESATTTLYPSHIYTGMTAKPPERQIPIDELPKYFDWCNLPDGRSFCGPSWNQHIPQYCGSCYIHGALHAANDRLNLLMNGKESVMLARQVIINCAPGAGLGLGCDGGEAADVFEYMHRYGLPDESCHNYLAKKYETEEEIQKKQKKEDQDSIRDDDDEHDHKKKRHHAHHDHDHHERRCRPIDECMNCMPTLENENVTECWPVYTPIRYWIKEYGLVSGEEAIMNELYQRGPLTCAFASVDDFDYNYRGGIYIDHTNATDSNHDVEVVGWGVDEETGIKYWRARNSWGTYWGENGYFRIIRGVNNMRFEEECMFGIFDAHELEQVLTGKKRGGMFGVVDERRALTTEVVKKKKKKKEHHEHQHKHKKDEKAEAESKKDKRT